MQDIVTNMRGTRAFDKTACRVMTLALAASALGTLTPAGTAGAMRPAHRSIWAIRWDRAHPVQAAACRRPAAHRVAHLRTAGFRARPGLRAARLAVVPHALPRVRVADFPPTQYIPAAVRPVTGAAPAPPPRPSKVLTEAGTPADVTLDFVSADISDVLKALSLQTHTNIVSGPDVKGAITVSLANVSLDQALDMISHISGFQYAKLDNTYVVGSAASLASFTSGADSATPVNAVIEFNFSDPTQLTQIITDRFPNVKVTQGKAVGTGSKSVLVVTGSQDDVDAVKQLVADTEQGLGRDVASAALYVYKIRYADASDLVQILGRFVPDLVVTPGASQRLAPVAPSTADAGGVTSTTTSYGAAGGVGGAGATVISETGTLPMKPTTDTLLLSGTAADITRAQQILAQVDTRPAQINFEAKVTDLDTTLARQLGLGYSFAGAQTTIGSVAGTTGAAPSTSQYRTALPFGYTPLSQFVNVQLYADQTKGDARILAAPNISAIDGQPAAIFIGNNVTYVSSITASTTGENVTTNTISAGIKLYITGKVDHDGYVTVTLHPEVSTYTLTAAAGGAELPNIATREATTTLRVRDGDYIAMGGLAENNEAKTTVGVPLLSDLPILGNLFRYDQKNREQREIVIFIHVSIEKDPPAPTPLP